MLNHNLGEMREIRKLRETLEKTEYQLSDAMTKVKRIAGDSEY